MQFTFGSKERNVPTGCPERNNLLSFRCHPLVLKFCPESANAFGAGARVPAQSSAEKFVFLFPLQA